ncbi:MAG: DUF2007 domain-containing protein [Chloroflexi bacterium]|nr:DUF2007 domain-containing protein [Chloroflexota bacterium]
MATPKSDLVEVCTVQGELKAQVIKSHLESEGIPVLLKYESLGRVIGITVDGLGEVKIMVPGSFYERAKEIIEPKNLQSEENTNNDI